MKQIEEKETMANKQMPVYHCEWMSLLYKLNTFELWEIWPCSDPTYTQKELETMNVKYAHEPITTHNEPSTLFWFCGCFFIIVFNLSIVTKHNRAQIS